jgi:hypothetical protein
VVRNKAQEQFYFTLHLSDSFPLQNGLGEGNVLSTLLFKFALEYLIMRKVKKDRDAEFEETQ